MGRGGTRSLPRFASAVRQVCGRVPSLLFFFRRNQLHFRKITLIARVIAGNEEQTFDFGVRADIKIRQRRGLCAATFSIGEERFAGAITRFVRKAQALKEGRTQPAVQRGLRIECGSEFGLDDWINQDMSLGGGFAELFAGSLQPLRISGDNVEQDVGVEHSRHINLRA